MAPLCSESSPSVCRLPQLYHGDEQGIINIAHRGASAYFPENTMASFTGAEAMHADMIELDVQLTKDGIPVVFHNAKLHKHTNGTGRINDYELKELKKLDAGSWFDPNFAGAAIPTLEQVLTYAAGKIAVNIEIKTEAVRNVREGGVEQQCLELVQKYEMGNYVLFSSFDVRAILRIKALDPDMPTGLLFSNAINDMSSVAALTQRYKADTFNCSYRQLRKKRLIDLQASSIPIFIYTVDEPARMRLLIKKGVKGIFTNKPDVLRRVIKSTNPEDYG